MDPVIFYRRATIQDVESLINLRLAFLSEISGSSASEHHWLGDSLRQYFADYISKEEFIAFVAQADSKVIASSGLVFHRHPPSNRNPTGREAYIMNMYTVPEYRSRGIATKLLQMLIDHARESGCGKISLHALPNDRSIYAKAGFTAMETEMRLNIVK